MRSVPTERVVQKITTSVRFKAQFHIPAEGQSPGLTNHDRAPRSDQGQAQGDCQCSEAQRSRGAKIPTTKEASREHSWRAGKTSQSESVYADQLASILHMCCDS